jgi:hypothetical protein
LLILDFKFQYPGVLGFWGFGVLGDKVGLYAVNATVETSFVGVGVGFRCVK